MNMSSNQYRSPEYFDSEEYYRLMRKRHRKHRPIHSTKYYNPKSIEAWQKSAILASKVPKLLSDEDDDDDEVLNERDGNEGDEIQANEENEEVTIFCYFDF